MLIIEGFLENGVFTPNKPLSNVIGRHNATLTIAANEENEKQERINAWRQFGDAILNSDEELQGEPERLRFKKLEEVI